MKRTLKCAIAAVGAAAIAIGTAVPASAANCGGVKTYVVSNSKSCGGLGGTDINSLFKNYSSCFDILKNYGITLPDCTGNQNNSNTQKPNSNTQKPGGNDCTDGSCYQKPSSNNCTGGNCYQKPTGNYCPDGNCYQKPTDNNCPDGSCNVTTPDKTDTSSSAVSDYEKKVAELVNEIRAEYGLSALKLNTELSGVARAKSQDMKDKNYFSHTSPTYGSPFDMMKTFGISYRTAGENIAMGYSTPEKVVDAWMNSEGHRANILNSSYKEIGVGYVSGGNYWTQMFIG